MLAGAFFAIDNSLIHLNYFMSNRNIFKMKSQAFLALKYIIPKFILLFYLLYYYIRATVLL